MSGGLYLPSVEFAKAAPAAPTATTQVGAWASQETLNQVVMPAAKQQFQASAAWAPAAILYGRDRIGPDLYDAGVLNGNLVLFVVWGYGPWDAIEEFTIDDKPAPAGVTVTHYDGSQSSYNATLAQLYGVTGDAGSLAQMVYPNLVYSVVVVPPGVTSGFPRCQARWRGRKLYDPRTGLTVWSDNPSLALADYRHSATYGMGRAIAWATVTACANANDATVGGAKRSTINLTLRSREFVEHWSDAIATYAECWVLDDGTTSRFVPDAAASPVMDFDHASGQILELAPLEFRRPAESPNVIEIAWTDTSQTPWREAVATAVADGVDQAGAEVRLSRIGMPGIHDASQAQRQSIQRLNKINLCDLGTRLKAPDRAAPIEPGDLVRVTHPCGLALKTFRVTQNAGQQGEYALALTEYDAACYSNTVVTVSSTPDTALPDPANPPAPTGLTLTEIHAQRADGTWGTAIAVAWSAATYAYLVGFRVEVWESGAMVDATTVITPAYRTPMVQDGRSYTVKVATLASGGAASAWTSNSLTALGVYLPPDPVPSGSLMAYEAGGIVFLAWAEAADAWRYRIKRGTTAQTYAQAAVVDLADGLRYMDRTAPSGTWRYWVESVDSVAVESGTPRSVDVVVTLDNNAFLVDSKDQTSPTLSAMLEYAVNRYDGVRRFVTNDGVAWNAKFTAAMSTYTSPVYAYFATSASSWTGEAEDFGQDLSGDWRATATVEALAGSVTSELQTATVAAYPTFTGAGGMTAKATGRYGRIKHSASAGSSIHAQIPTQNIRIDAIPREEVIAFTSSAAGPITLTLANIYSKAKRIVVQPSGNTARFGLYDNVVVGNPTTVDCYVFNDSGVKIASPATLIFQGV